ncbi:MAG: DUF188 domain-containing protein [Spirochaetes bacterium]|nr:DUF188 domain-containing protein [Spirochaetota bacterium]
MKILLDADSCPKGARELAIKRSAQLNIKLIFAANRQIPEAQGAVMEICGAGENSADDRIVELAAEGDLVISRDIPLAKRLVEKNISVIDDRGRVFTKENINEALSLRNFMVGLAENGMGAVRQKNYGKKELKTFADSLDRILARQKP